MPIFSPTQSTLSMAWESTFGTAGTSNRFAPTLSGSVDVSRERSINSLNRLGSNVPIDFTPILSHTTSITINGLLSNLYWVRAITGSTQTVSGTNPYTHTWSFNTSSPTITSATIEVGNQRFVGCVIENASISCTVDEPVRFTTGFRSGFIPSTISVTQPATTGQDVFIYVGTTLTGLGFGASDVVRSITVNFNPNIEQVKRIGLITPVNALKRIFEISIDCEVLFDNYSVITDTIGGTLTRYSATTDAIIEMISGGNRTLRLKFRDIAYRVISWNKTPENLVYARLSGVVRTPASSIAEMITDTNTTF